MTHTALWLPRRNSDEKDAQFDVRDHRFPETFITGRAEYWLSDWRSALCHSPLSPVGLVVGKRSDPCHWLCLTNAGFSRERERESFRRTDSAASLRMESVSKCVFYSASKCVFCNVSKCVLTKNSFGFSPSVPQNCSFIIWFLKPHDAFHRTAQKIGSKKLKEDTNTITVFGMQFLPRPGKQQ